MWHVYIINCSDGTLYTGISNDVPKRIKAHNSGKGAKYTRTRRPVILLQQFECPNRSEASKLEYKIKQLSRKQKFEMIQPTNLEEAIRALYKMFNDQEKEQIKSGIEEDICRYHHGLGTWIRNNWGLWSGGPLQDHFKSLGLWHADDMSGVILDSFYRHMKGLPLDVEGQVKYYLDYWKKQKER